MDRCSYRGQLSREKKQACGDLDRSSSYRGAIEQTETFSIDPAAVEVSVETALRRSPRVSIDGYVSRGIEEVSSCLEEQFFKRGKTQT